MNKIIKLYYNTHPLVKTTVVVMLHLLLTIRLMYLLYDIELNSNPIGFERFLIILFFGETLSIVFTIIILILLFFSYQMNLFFKKQSNRFKNREMAKRLEKTQLLK